MPKTLSAAPPTAAAVATAAVAAPAGIPKASRLLSLDAFRGLTIGGMVLANNPGSWGHIYAPLKHAAWHGWTPTDLIFPAFLFIVGVATPLSFAARLARGSTRGELAVGVVVRGASLVLLGLLLHSLPGRLPATLPGGFGLLRALQLATYLFVPAAFVLLLWPWKTTARAAAVTAGVAAGWVLIFLLTNHQVTRAAGLLSNVDFGSGLLDPRKLRFPGVLQRIGLCYLAAGLLAVVGGRAVIVAAAIAASLLYLVLMSTVSFDGSVPGSFDRDTNLARAIDVAVFGPHAYGEYPDPEGLLSTLPAVTTTLIGLLVGLGLRSCKSAADKPIVEQSARMMAAGVLLAVAGTVAGWWGVPVNKQIWTPSYAVLSAGLACLGLGAMFYAIDVRGRRGWAVPLVALGTNAILIFLLSGAVGRLMGLVAVSPTWLPGTIDATTRPASVGVRSVLTAWATHLQQSATPATWHSPQAASLAYAVGFLAAVWVVAAVLYRIRCFVKV